MGNTTDNMFDIHSLTKMSISLAMLCVGAYIVIPIPIASAALSAQTVILNLIAFIFRPKQTFLLICVYLLLGMTGMPVFVGGSAGIGEFFGPRGGFLIAFAIAYPLMSILKGKTPSFRRYSMVAILIGIPLTYIGAVISVMYFMQVDLKAACFITVLPFLPGDIIKALVASALGVRLNRIWK